MGWGPKGGEVTQGGGGGGWGGGGGGGDSRGSWPWVCFPRGAPGGLAALGGVVELPQGLSQRPA